MTPSVPPPLRVGVVVPAAGRGVRMGGAKKAYLNLEGEPVLLRALRPFLARPDVIAIRVALAPEDVQAPPAWLEGLDPRLSVVAGGATRGASVRAALEALPDVDVVVVHDGARPLLDPDVLARCVRAACEGKGAVAGFPAVDTLKEVADGRVLGTPARERFWHPQTPQAFPAQLLRAAYLAWEPDQPATDDAALVERLGGPVVMVEASPENLKVTRPEDLALASRLLEERQRRQAAR